VIDPQRSESAAPAGAIFRSWVFYQRGSRATRGKNVQFILLRKSLPHRGSITLTFARDIPFRATSFRMPSGTTGFLATRINI
jgi:hypothetical protein